MSLFVSFDKIQNLDFAGLVVLFHEFLSFHSSEIVEGSDGQRELSVFLLEGDFQLKVLELVLFAANISGHVFGGEFDVQDGEAFAVIEMDFNVIQQDVGSLPYFIVGLEVGLEVVLGSSHFYFGGILEDERVLVGDVEEERGVFERLALELGLDVGVDERGDTGELHFKVIITRPQFNPIYNLPANKKSVHTPSHIIPTSSSARQSLSPIFASPILYLPSLSAIWQ